MNESDVVHICIQPVIEHEHNGKTYLWEWGEYTGPTFLTKRGENARRITDKHWAAFHDWFFTRQSLAKQFARRRRSNEKP